MFMHDFSCIFARTQAHWKELSPSHSFSVDQLASGPGLCAVINTCAQKTLLSFLPIRYLSSCLNPTRIYYEVGVISSKDTLQVRAEKPQ